MEDVDDSVLEPWSAALALPTPHASWPSGTQVCACGDTSLNTTTRELVASLTGASLLLPRRQRSMSRMKVCVSPFTPAPHGRPRGRASGCGVAGTRATTRTQRRIATCRKSGAQLTGQRRLCIAPSTTCTLSVYLSPPDTRAGAVQRSSQWYFAGCGGEVLDASKTYRSRIGRGECSTTTISLSLGALQTRR